MTFSSFLQKVMLLSLIIMAITYFNKEKLPSPDYYDIPVPPPIQTKTDRKVFEVSVDKEHYHITPLYDYQLEGIVVSKHHSDAFLDMSHEEWRDYLNIADLCVIWGDNVKNGVYQDMKFKNGNWTCYFSWPNSAVRQRFKEEQLSNNHLLTDNSIIKKQILGASPGDHIRLKGILVNYANRANQFNRGTSTSRTDRGQGACEVIYIKSFDFIQKANSFQRILFEVSKVIFFFSLFLSLLLYFTSRRKKQL